MMFTDEALLHPRNVSRALALGGVMWLAVSRNARVHAVGVTLGIAGALLYGVVRGQF